MNKKDPISRFLSEQPWLLNQHEVIQNKINDAKPNLKVWSIWADGLEYDDFFDKDLNNKFLITNNVVKCRADQSRHVHTVNPSYYGAYFFDYPNDNIPINKDLNFFSNRFDIFRQSWLYQLIRHNLFDRAYVSFNMDHRNVGPHSSVFQGLSAKESFELSYKNFNSIFVQEHESIKNKIPYKNFDDNGDLTPIVLSSKFSIVAETFFHDNRIITFSEKTFRCLQLPRPWLLFSTQHAVDYLRDLGFDVLDDVIDHAYDGLETPVQRQTAILEQCKLLVNLDIDRVLSRCEQAATANKQILAAMHKVWLVNIMKDLELAEKKISAL